jgi:hypothetical protein
LKKLLSTLAAIVVFTIGRGQSFEGVIKYDVSSDSPGNFSIGIEHTGTLTIKDGNVHTVLKSKREGQIDKVYLADRDTSYQIDHIRQRYVIMPKLPEVAEVKVKETSDTKKILQHKCIKYTGEGYTFWIAEDLTDIDCKLLLENLPFVPCKQINGFPMKMDVSLPNGSYTITVIEIRPMKVPDYYFDLNKDYSIEMAPLIRRDH